MEVIAVNDDRREDEDVEQNSSDKVGRDHDHDRSEEDEGGDQDRVEEENGVRSSDDGVKNESEKDDVEESKSRRDYGKVERPTTGGKGDDHRVTREEEMK
ncbi:hypothetical protein Tco_1146433 [Tanacetum coccineum]